jgi:hypothetical protein
MLVAAVTRGTIGRSWGKARLYSGISCDGKAVQRWNPIWVRGLGSSHVMHEKVTAYRPALETFAVQILAVSRGIFGA